MPGWVEKDAETVLLARLVRVFDRAQRHRGRFGLVKVVHGHVDVKLLGPVGAGPDGRLVVRGQLEAEPVPDFHR